MGRLPPGEPGRCRSGRHAGPPGLAQLWVVCARKEEDGGPKFTGFPAPQTDRFYSQGSSQKLVPLAHAIWGFAKTSPYRCPTGMGQP